MNRTSIYDRIYDLVRQIPSGNVATYGQIARMHGGCTPRMVGYALATLPADHDVPWHRVINARGEISPRSSGHGGFVQRRMLEIEGVRFDEQDRVNLKEIRWSGLEDEKRN